MVKITKMKSVLMCMVGIGLCFTACETNVPDEGNKDSVQNGVIIRGVFSVGPDGKQVRFSMGNLQYQASTKTWRFASQQYEYVGDDNKNISDTYDGWIDLFGWGTGDNPTNASTKYEDYATFVDWGTNTISNGGNQPNRWRTFTSEEWNYIIEGRPNAKTLYAPARISIDDNTAIFGMIILPDDWSSIMSIELYGGQIGWTSVDYDISLWAKMESAGAVFLPAAGYHYNHNANYVQIGGYYWYSTEYSNLFAYNLYFNDYYISPRCTLYRGNGYSVRLVQDF